ncbi:GntR family transcriptional regulator [Ilumatobacter nonamiensis]|uniref:GntR family transcriptional regulator n=1 Tax=Ilumatobacter nonamiensis TaxID=467093 RepID=UPI0003449FCE|nr:GntR family transcriptional regulator [Ilumatobacter nonamiensis]
MTPSPPSAEAETTSAAARITNEQLYRQLRVRITRLDLEPGARLTEEALAKQYGVSRTPIRRVLDRLAHDGLVTINPNSGASVSSIDFQALREVWALRLRIADLVGDFVRLPASPEIRERLEACLEQLDDVESAADLAPLYDEYHEVMLDLLTNGPLRSIYDQLYAQTARAFVQMLPSLDLDTEIEQIRSEIEASLDACGQRSGVALAEVRRHHMQLVLERLNDALGFAPARPATSPPNTTTSTIPSTTKEPS